MADLSFACVNAGTPGPASAICIDIFVTEGNADGVVHNVTDARTFALSKAHVGLQ